MTIETDALETSERSACSRPVMRFAESADRTECRRMRCIAKACFALER
jgi:hypothetical protein